jgi:hypothetical protein
MRSLDGFVFRKSIRHKAATPEYGASEFEGFKHKPIHFCRFKMRLTCGSSSSQGKSSASRHKSNFTEGSRRSKSRQQIRWEVYIPKYSAEGSLFIDMPFACLCIFVDGLVELQLHGIGPALFKSIKFQFLASEDDFITFRPVFQFFS